MTRREVFGAAITAGLARRLGAETSKAISNPECPDPAGTLPRTLALLQRLQDAGMQVGAQVYVSRKRKKIADFGIGLAAPDVPMSPDSLLIWFSSTKAVTATAVAQQWERGKFELDDPVARHIPEFGRNGKDRVTIRHVLTHRGGFRFADGRGIEPLLRPNAANLKLIYDAPLEPGWVPGQKAGYHPTAGWFVLGELVERTSGRPFSRYVREEIFQPLGMRDSWIGMPAEQFRAYGSRNGQLYVTAAALDKPQPAPNPNSESVATNTIPGANGRGPMRELGRFYEMLMQHGELDGRRILRPQTVEAMTARHRVGMVDQTFGITLDWGLGLMIDTFYCGSYCSPRAYGHAGALSSVGFCDPEHDLVAALILNGMPDRKVHNQRMLDVADALYLDLGIAAESTPKKTRELPVAG